MESIIRSELSADQAGVFEEAKRMVTEEYGSEIDEFMVFQFCKANDFDISRAVEAYKENVGWRAHYNVHNILDEYTAPPVLQAHFPLYILGLDNEGSAILVFELGTADINGLANCVTIEEVKQHLIFVLQMGEKYMDDNLVDVNKRKWFVLINCKDFPPLYGANKIFRQTANDLTEMLLKNYPERLKTAFIINATPAIHAFLKHLKESIPDDVFNKVKVFEATEWADQLKELIDESILPKYLGGKLTDLKTATTITPIVRGSQIPKELFSDVKRNYLKSFPGVIEYTLQKFEKYNVKIQVWQEGTHLRWEFETELHSIAFGLNFMKDDTAKPIILIPSKRTYAINRTEAGEYLCEEKGTYILIFDNSSSKFTSKKLYYKYDIGTK